MHTVSILGNLYILTALPVELASFSGQFYKNEVHLKWSTASEINNDYFTLERSIDGIRFESIGEIKGAGNSNSVLHYSFSDTHPYPGINYYRLKQTDFDGAFKYSEIIPVKPGINGYSLFCSYNADEHILRLHLPGNTDKSQVRIIALLGETKFNSLVSGTEVNLDVSFLSEGIYLVEVVSGSETNRVKFVKD